MASVVANDHSGNGIGVGKEIVAGGTIGAGLGEIGRKTFKEHDTNKRESNRNKHEIGKARREKDQRKEKKEKEGRYKPERKKEEIKILLYKKELK